MIAVDLWLDEIESLLGEISSSSEANAAVIFPSASVLRVPSVREVVEAELSAEEPRDIAELRVQREDYVRHLECFKWNQQIEQSRKMRAAVSQRTPFSNALLSLPAGSSSCLLGAAERKRLVLEFEMYSVRYSAFTSSVYGLENTPEQLSKTLALEIPASSSFGALFDAVTDALPVRRSYEGTSYSNGGMFIFSSPLTGARSLVLAHRRGGENFCDYSQYVGLQDADVRDMDACSLLEGLQLLTSGATQFGSQPISGVLVHTGDATERLFLTNAKFVQSSEAPHGAVRELYRRSVRKMSWCVLCGSRVAELAVLDDCRLPHSPCFVCKSCYREFSSDQNGHFLEPDPHVGVYVYREF